MRQMLKKLVQSVLICFTMIIIVQFCFFSCSSRCLRSVIRWINYPIKYIPLICTQYLIQVYKTFFYETNIDEPVCLTLSLDSSTNSMEIWLRANKKQQHLVLKAMQKITQHEKSLISKNLHLTYREYLARNKTLTGYQIGDYIILQKLGQGSFGTVFYGIHVKQKIIVALKVIDLEIIEDQPNHDIKKKKRRLAKTQTQLMFKTHSDNIIKCCDVFQNKSLKIIVLELCNQGSLQQKIDKMTRIPQSEAVEILKQVLNGLIQLHQNNIIHRDLKPQNILIHDGVYKIADFGFSKQLVSNDFKKELVQTNLGTPAYMAPEVYNRKKYGLNADIWSVGVIFFTMLYGRCPFENTQRTEIQAKVKSKSFFDTKPYEKDVKISPQSKLFILQCLDLDSQKRLNWKNISKHQLFHSTTNQKPQYSSSILGSQRKQTLLERAKMEHLDETNNCDHQSVSTQDQYFEPSETVRAILLPPEQFAKVQRLAKKMMPITDLPWSKLANFQCLKAEFILEELIEPLQYLPSKISDSRQVVQIVYLMVARCFQDISVKYWEKQRYRHKVIPGFMKILENLYRKVQEKFDSYAEKLPKKEIQVLDIIKDKFLGLFGDNQQSSEKEVFFTCNKKNLQKGLAFSGYTRGEQINYTQFCLQREMQRIGKQIGISKDVMKYTRNYDKICKLTVKQVGEVYFRTYVTNLFINQ